MGTFGTVLSALAVFVFGGGFLLLAGWAVLIMIRGRAKINSEARSHRRKEACDIAEGRKVSGPDWQNHAQPEAERLAIEMGTRLDLGSGTLSKELLGLSKEFLSKFLIILLKREYPDRIYRDMVKSLIKDERGNVLSDLTAGCEHEIGRAIRRHWKK